MYNRRQEMKKNLELQLDILESMQKRHQGWADATDDPETARIHIETSRLIREATMPYSGLLERYDRHAKQDMPTERQDPQSTDQSAQESMRSIPFTIDLVF